VNPGLYTFIALDIARERSREAERNWLAASLANNRPSRTTRLRRQLARILAIVSRASGSIARRLDSRPADDLPRTLAAE
jgi:hypothetical protein